MEQIKITLVKSLIAAKPAQKKTAESLGLRKIGDTFVGTKNDAVIGKVKVIRHLVKAENA